jgi:hypothetical protein
MYSDPALIRKNVIKLSLNDREDALIDAFCSYSGEQKATLIRELVLAHAAKVIHSASFTEKRSNVH